MIPLLVKPPAGKPARILGIGPAILRVVQDLRSAGWPIVLHDPEGGGSLSGLSGIRIALDAPAAAAVRQSSLVLIGRDAPPEWADSVRQALEGSGVPVFDEEHPRGSSLGFPAWFPGESLSLAAWGGDESDPWKERLWADFLRGAEDLFLGFRRLSEDLRELAFDSMEDEDFRRDVVSQISRPEILALLLQDRYDDARNRVLKIVGTTTRRL